MRGLHNVRFRRCEIKGPCSQSPSKKPATSGDLKSCTEACSYWTPWTRGRVSKLHAASGDDGCPQAAAQASVQQTGLTSRRYYDLTYVLIVLLAFPLYWLKVVDWRLCSAYHAEENDPWLIQVPPSAWTTAWPCNGGQLSQLRHVLASPMPFLRSLVWPVCYSELHFFTSFYTVFVGGLLMLAVTQGSKYDTSNPWRLSWAFICRVQVRTTPLIVKLLRPQTPWPLSISQSLPLEAPANVLYNVALMSPWRHQALGALVDVLLVSMICRLFGDNWPHAMPPRLVVLLHAACGLLTVITSALMPGSPSRRPVSGGEQADSTVGRKSLEQVVGKTCGPSDEGEGRIWGQGQGLCRRRSETAGGDQVEVHGAVQDFAASKVTPLVAESGIVSEYLSTPAEPAASLLGLRSDPGCGAEQQQLLQLCRRLILGETTTVQAAGPQWPSTHASTIDDGSANRPPDPSPNLSSCDVSTGVGRCQLKITEGGPGADGGITSNDDNGRERPRARVKYGDTLTWTHMHVKVPHVQPSDLSPRASTRLVDAVIEAYPDVACADVTVRSGCIEVHLDLVHRVAPAGPEEAVGAVGSAVGQRAPPDAESDMGMNMRDLAPASAEQQGLASCILHAIGLPQGYNAAVRAQVGAHLLTLTPAAGSGGSWAVSGTRRMQAHEVPWVTRVDPPAVVVPAPPVVPAAATGVTGGSIVGNSTSSSNAVDVHVATTLRLTISGTAERLAVAHEDGDLEVLGLFEGAFLRFSDLQWGPLEESPYAAVGGCSAADGAVALAPRMVRLPPSLALSRRALTANLALPCGRTGAVSLLLMRRGTAGQSHSLLLLQPGDASIAGEVAALQEMSHAAAWGVTADGCSPSASSVASFVRDLGHWLQYRDFWRRKAAAVCQPPATGGGGRGGARSARLSGRLSALWMGSLLPWSRRNGSAGGGGGLGLQVKPLSYGRLTGQQAVGPERTEATITYAHSRGHAAATHAHLHHQTQAQVGDSDLLDQDSGGGEGRRSQARGGSQSSSPPGRHGPFASANRHMQLLFGMNGSALPSPSGEEQERLAQGSLPAFGQRAYQDHMRTARRLLLEFALEQRCAAVAAALLEPAPVPSLPQLADAGAASAYGSASYLAELAEFSRAANHDGLTLLHRAVRSGDVATVEVILHASARATDAAAALAAATAALQPRAQPGVEGASSQRRLNLYNWDTPDVHGITPLHYLAVLDDGGALARHVLSTHSEALALWELGRPDMPSPASFATQNGVNIDTDVLRRQREREANASRGGSAGAKAQRTRPLVLTALLGFPSCEVEHRYQRFAWARAQCGVLPASLVLLLLHVLACAAGLVQAFSQPHASCRRGMLPLVMLQGASFLLALYCHQLTALVPRNLPCGVAAWVMQSLALALLLAKTIGMLTQTERLSCTDLAVGAANNDSGSSGAASGWGLDAGCVCGSAVLHQGLLGLHHALAVAAVPYKHPYALHKVLAVQVVEVVACVLLLAYLTLGRGSFSLTAAGGLMDLGDGADATSAIDGSEGGGGYAAGSRGLGVRLARAGLAAAHVAGGSLLRCVTSAVLILAADLRARAAFVCSYSQQPALVPQQQKKQEDTHAKVD
ncbi:hypothetical protein VaNZ11_009223 [Volvox africanus]|uniref:Uncharacterized protein n=1 Tax=Volvox africanus TaxID=51714 RepID=A0ABQ5S7R9_9CHLO|nr:hypothetical protein VaNZ11_009223 [Volvox africanus]